MTNDVGHIQDKQIPQSVHQYIQISNFLSHSFLFQPFMYLFIAHFIKQKTETKLQQNDILFSL
jgi:hypothetical protein